MKIKLNGWVLGLAVGLALPRAVWAQGNNDGDRFNDYMDLGCHITGSRPGGIQSQCAHCEEGMPIWWVDEPYINLWVSDEPLSYFTSYGERMTFRWTYHERGQVEEPWRSRETEALNLTNTLQIPRVLTRYTRNAPGGIEYSMTNAVWTHNWWQEIVFWDGVIETNTSAPTVTTQLDSSFNATNAYVKYTSGYQGLLFRGDGGTIPFTVANTNSPTTSGLISVQVLNLTNLNDGPKIPHKYQDSSGSNVFPYANNSLFFVINPQSGFKVLYPDGSQEIYGLVLAHHDVTLDNNTFVFGPPPKAPRVSTASAYMTERIDPQGRSTRIGYQPYFTVHTDLLGNPLSTNFACYTVGCVVDPDGRTNTYTYYTNIGPEERLPQLVSITDPYGRSAQFTPQSGAGYSTNGFAAITDAQSNTTTFTYQSVSNGWLSKLVTPYGTTTFTNYELQESTNSGDIFLQRALYASEPGGAQQLFYYFNQAPGAVPSSQTAPTVPGETYDNGTAGSGSSANYSLVCRDSFHWGPRQFAALSSNVTTHLANLPVALGYLTTNDLAKAHLKHWLQAADIQSVTETLSCERDPSVDAAGSVPGAWTFYGNGNDPTAPEIDQGAQVTSVARLLPDTTSQYTRYDYSIYSPVVVSDSETSVTLPDGSAGERTNWFSYSSTNLIDLLAVSNSLGQYVTFGYTNHQVTRVTNALNEVTSLGYDTNTHNLTGISFPGGGTVTLTYYAGSSPPTSTSSLLEQIEVEPEGRFVNFTDYSNSLPRIVHVSGTGLTDLYLTNYWDGLNRLTGVAFTDGTTISNVYTKLDRTAHKDRLGHWTYFGFDALEHLTAITNTLTNVTQLSWCGCGALSSIVDAALNTNYLFYDNQGKLTNILFPDTSSLTYQYDLVGRMTNVFDGSGRGAKFGYNLQGLVNAVSNVNGQVFNVAYDLVDRPHVVTDANNVSVTYGFDALNRVVTRTVGSSTTEGFVYTNNGLITYTNADQKVTHFGRDLAGRLITVTNANSETNLIGYDAADHVTSLIDGLTHTTTWQYNQYGWLTGKLDNLSHLVLSNGFDADGELTARWTPAGGNTVYRYDVVGNLTNVDYSGAAIATPSVSLAYDQLDQLTNLIDAVGTTGLSYTATGQLLTEDGPWTNDTVVYGYTQGQRTSLSLSQPGTGNWTQSYVYDSISRLQTLTSPAGAFGYGYFASTPASALVQSITLPNYASITNHYDSLERLDVTALVNYWGHALDGYSYQYDALGLRTNITRNLGLTANNVSVGYDNIGQITSWNAQETNGTLRRNEQLGYGYDAADNLHLRTNNALVQTFNTDALNELSNVTRTGAFTLTGATPAPATNVTVNGTAAQLYSDLTFAGTNLSLSNGSNTFTIISSNIYNVKATNAFTVNLPTNVSFQSDANGNLTSDGTRSFVYDAENQLTNVNVAGQWKTEFVYDGFGRRRKSFDYTWAGTNWVKTNETRFVYDGMLIIQERDSNNAVQVIYTRGLDLSGGLQGAGGIGGLLARTDATNGSTFYHADGAGNITSLMDASQNIVARYLYDPFGRLTGKWGTNADANVMRFSSMPTHRQSGLSLYAFRAYDPSLQRWLNRDPIGEAGGINLFRITHNNPANQIDPLGFDDDPLAAQMMQNEMMDYYMGDGWSALDQQRRRQMFDMVSDAADFIGVGQVVRGMEESDQSLLLGAKDVAVGTANFGMLFWPLGKGKALATASEKCIVGKAGSYAALKKLAKVGDKVVAHHMPQAALKFTGRAEGGAIVITEAEHFLTRTFGSRGAKLAIEEAAENFGDVLAKDISDLREIVGSKYDEGIKELSKYYMEHFPELFSK